MKHLRRMMMAHGAIAILQQLQRRQTLRKLNLIYAQHPSQPDPVLSQMQFMSLSPERW